jgi:c(7)-type cytochrome triheme protein
MRSHARMTLVLLAAAAGFAGGRLPTIRYRGGAEGRVVFDHQVHAAKGFRCNDCHTDFAGSGRQLFATRRSGLITFADHSANARCFACHDGKGPADDGRNPAYTGKGAFDNCERCHFKPTVRGG